MLADNTSSRQLTRVGFIIEQALGHVTHTKNLQANVPKDPAIEAHWGLVPFDVTGMGTRIPIFNSNWTVRAGLRARRALAGLTRRTRLDALFFHTQVPAVLAGKWIRRYPTIVSLDATPLQYDELGASYAHGRGPEWLESLKWRMNRDCFRYASHIVAWSEWAKRGLVKDYEVPPDKVSVIPPGVNVADWVAPTRRSARTGPVKLLFVGADLRRKGGHHLIEAWSRLRERHSGSGRTLELHLVTKTVVPQQPGLFVHTNLQANSPGLKKLYHESDIFCLPTLGDCLPMVLSEAGAAGLPSISTNVAAIGEITRDGETGLIIPPDDVNALEGAIERLVCDEKLRLTLGTAGVRLVSNQYDAEANARKLLSLIKDVASSAKTREGWCAAATSGS